MVQMVSDRTAVKSDRLLFLLAALVVAATFCLHCWGIIAHFASGGYFLDGGWFAYLFASDDPWLRGPKALGTESFYQHHLSPVFFLLGAPLHKLGGLTGIEIFALHQGFFFALFAAALASMALAVEDTRDRAVALVACFLIGVLATPLLRAAAYPHFEIALIALSATSLAAYQRGLYVLFALALAALLLIREDGGLYAAMTAMIIAATRLRSARREELIWLLAFAVAGTSLSFIEQFAQHWLFPATDTFFSNFGDGPHQFSFSELWRRIGVLSQDSSLVLICVGTLLLVVVDPRYVAGLAFAAPMLALYLLSPRPVLWTFSLYYALPWLIACLGWIFVFAARSQEKRVRPVEGLIFALLSLLLAAPVQAAFQVVDRFWTVPLASFQRPLDETKAEIDFLRRQTLAARGAGEASLCASEGVASLLPDAFEPQQVFYLNTAGFHCGALLLMNGQDGYSVLALRARDAGLAKVENFQSAEVWRPATRAEAAGLRGD